MQAPVSRRRRRGLQTAARAALQRAARVVFVYKGNIGRSPFTAAIAGRLLRDDQDIASAGFLQAAPIAGRRRRGRRRLAGRPHAHRSRVVSAELVGRSDAIFVFDHRHYSRMIARFPDARNWLHLIGALDAAGPLFVPDPWGRGPEAYTAIYRRIAETLSVAITR